MKRITVIEDDVDVAVDSDTSSRIESLTEEILDLYDEYKSLLNDANIYWEQ